MLCLVVSSMGANKEAKSCQKQKPAKNLASGSSARGVKCGSHTGEECHINHNERPPGWWRIDRNISENHTD